LPRKGLFSFSRGERLRKSWQFDQVFRTGRRRRGALVRLLFLESPDGSTAFGVAAGKKLGPAPIRNRGKRMLREAIRTVKPFVRPGFWIVCSIRENALDSNAREVYADLVRLLEQAKLLRTDAKKPEWSENENR